MKKLKLIVLWGLFVTGFWYMIYPESVPVTMTDGEHQHDFRIALLDTADLLFVTNSNLGENMEVMHGFILTMFVIMFLIHTIYVIRMIIFDTSDTSDSSALVGSVIILQLIGLTSLYLISLLAIWFPVTGSVLVVLTGIAFIIISIGSGISMVEDERGFFNVYDSLVEYFNRTENYKEYVTGLKQIYKNQIQ